MNRNSQLCFLPFTQYLRDLLFLMLFQFQKSLTIFLASTRIKTPPFPESITEGTLAQWLKRKLIHKKKDFLLL